MNNKDPLEEDGNAVNNFGAENEEDDVLTHGEVDDDTEGAEPDLPPDAPDVSSDDDHNAGGGI